MVKLYLCRWCQKGKHGKCERSTSVPKGQFGGSRCTCGCDGNKNWGKIQKDIFKNFLQHYDNQQNK